MTLGYFLRKAWEQHKGTIFGLAKTLLVFFIFILIKRGLSKVLPEAIKAKLKSILL